MTSLKNRLATLETSKGAAFNFVTILRTVLPSGTGPWTAKLYDEQIDSESGESEADFGVRLSALAKERRLSGKHAATVVMTETDTEL